MKPDDRPAAGRYRTKASSLDPQVENGLSTANPDELEIDVPARVRGRASSI
jgi:hypothetical protein